MRAGRLFILPSTHIYEELYIAQQVHYIIARSKKLEHPDFFLTITFSSNLPEIRGDLFAVQIAQDKPLSGSWSIHDEVVCDDVLH